MTFYTWLQVKERMCRYFSRLGFKQVEDGKFWVLEWAGVVDKLLPKDEVKELAVKRPRTLASIEGVHEEFRDAIMRVEVVTPDVRLALNTLMQRGVARI